jgi:hypothetical protein
MQSVEIEYEACEARYNTQPSIGVEGLVGFLVAAWYKSMFQKQKRWASQRVKASNLICEKPVDVVVVRV